jgi:N-acetylneuraminic acid mutarotase
VISGEKPLNRAQHVALTTPADKQERIFVFGGHHDPNSRLNDTWFFEIKSMQWRRVGSEKDNTQNLESAIGAPSPRANTSAVLYDGKVYVFGGHGGVSFARIAFNDMYAFDLATETWEKIQYGNNPPEPRGGHSTFASGDGKIFVYGGWNSE